MSKRKAKTKEKIYIKTEMSKKRKHAGYEERPRSQRMKMNQEKKKR